MYITSEEVIARKQLRRAFEAEKEKRTQKIKQKLLGLLAIGIGIASPILLNDATVSLLFIPLGLFVFFTKENVLY